jgi:hypothetical protein
MRILTWRASVILLFATLATAAGRADDKFQWRPAVSIRLLNTPKWDVTAGEEVWISGQGPNPTYWQSTARVRYKGIPYVWIGAGYSYIENQTANSHGQAVSLYQNRAEFEVSPHFELTNGWRFLNRNRVEFRWIEDAPEESTRTRNLFEVIYPLKLPAPFEDMFSSAEIFYNWTIMRFTEYRLSPVGFDIKLSSHASLRTYYTWREVLSSGEWNTTQVFWTVLNLRLK